MNNYLILNFKSAKLFRKFNKDKVNFRCKDYVRDQVGTYISRDYLPAFVEPITVYQISNMLHVLFNERPVPSLRKSYYEKNEYYFNKAQNSFLKIDTPKINNGDFYYETVQVKKAVWNSWNPMVRVDWELIRKYVDDPKKLSMFVSKLNSLFGLNVKDIPFLDIRKMVQNLPAEKRIELYIQITELRDVSGLIYFFGRYENGVFCKPDDGKLVAKLDKSARTVVSGVETAAVLSGQIIVPVSDADIEKLKTSSKGFARILDNGFVWIDSVKNENYLSVEEFIPVKNISTEKTKPFKTL